MNTRLAVLATWLVASVALAESAQTRGHLVLIGGGEKPRDAMETFVRLAGGPDASIVVIPTASEEPDIVEYYMSLLGQQYGCRNVTVLPVRTRTDAQRLELAAQAREAKGIFFAGGDQVRITAALLDTPLLAAIAEAFGRGAVIGGTSAGTACQSPLMITGEGDFTIIRAGAVELKPGLGFFSGVIVDQHFVARQRLNRLLTVLLEHPHLLGVGVDEDTAVWVRPDNTFVVLGHRSVVVLDAQEAKVHRREVEGHAPALGAHGLRVSILLPGETYDLTRRQILAP
ncbi:MAG: cyanophycinase [Acidobacteriota bacterium]